MNIVLSTDNNFVQHCAVTMVSILENNKDVSFFIITDGLTDSNSLILSELAKKYDSSLQFLLVDKSIVSRLPMPDNSNLKHISPATYYRLFVAELLPDSVDKVIYLDCDMVIRGSLAELWNTDIQDYAIAAVFQDNNWAIKNHTFERLSLPESHGYFNAGMLLINVSYWRINHVQDRFLDYLTHNRDKIVYHDQDVLNVTLQNSVLGVSPIWNMQNGIYFFKGEVLNCGYYKYSYDELKCVISQTVIIHFVSRPKPWEYGCNHPLCIEYFNYLERTPFSGWKPSFKVSNIWEYRIKPFLGRMKRIFTIAIL